MGLRAVTEVGLADGIHRDVHDTTMTMTAEEMIGPIVTGNMTGIVDVIVMTIGIIEGTETGTVDTGMTSIAARGTLTRLTHLDTTVIGNGIAILAEAGARIRTDFKGFGISVQKQMDVLAKCLLLHKWH